MKKQKGLTNAVGIFVGLAVAGISVAVSSQIVPNDFAQIVMVSIGSAIFGAGLTFFLIRMNNLLDK